MVSTRPSPVRSACLCPTFQRRHPPSPRRPPPFRHPPWPGRTAPPSPCRARTWVAWRRPWPSSTRIGSTAIWEPTLDPLGTPPRGDPALDPAFHDLDPGSLDRISADLLDVNVPGDTLAEVLEALRATYSGTIAYEVEHIADHAERRWLRAAIESGEHRSQLKRKQRRRLLARLSAVEGLEHFLHKAYLGQKRFSIEGLDTMVPMLDLVLELVAERGTRRVVIGMAHRGRLNVLAHIVGLPLESILAEFEAGTRRHAATAGRERDRRREVPPRRQRRPTRRLTATWR